MNRTVSVGAILKSVAIILLAIAIFFKVPPLLTGMITDTVGTNVSVDSFDDGRISYFVYPPSANQYRRMNISVEFTNTGSTSYDTRIEIYVLDMNYTNITKMQSGVKGMKPGNRVFYQTSYIPMEWNYTWLHVVVRFKGKMAEAWGLLYVAPYFYWPYPPPEEGGGGGGEGGGGKGGGGGGGGGTGGGGGKGGGTGGVLLGEQIEVTPYELLPGLDGGVVGFEIAYPRIISINPGGSSVAYIIANNTGSMTLRNLMVLGHSTGAKFDVYPKTIAILPGRSATVFMVTFDAPESTIPGMYLFDFNVLANRANASGSINLNIGAVETEESLNQTIMNYIYIASRMADEIDSLKLLGRNMTAASGYVEEAKALLKEAKDDYDAMDYDSVRYNLKRTRPLLIKVAAEIALARSVGFFIALSPAKLLLFVLVAVALIAGAAVHIHRANQEKKKKEEALPASGFV